MRKTERWGVIIAGPKFHKGQPSCGAITRGGLRSAKWRRVTASPALALPSNILLIDMKTIGEGTPVYHLSIVTR